MSITPLLTWLHLSDLHLGEIGAWSEDVVLTSLLADIRKRYTSSNHPDLLFITGDVAASGKAEDYVRAEGFVTTLCTTLALGLDRLCMIPGNHDIDLDVEPDAFAGVRRTLDCTDQVDRFLSNEGRRRTLFRRQAAFRAFANRLSPPDCDPMTDCSYAHCRILQVGVLRVRVLLLDSAWLASGTNEDSGALLLGERQLIDCAAQSGTHKDCLTFALMHHPLAWLREFEQVPVENLLLRHAHVCLRGHVHSADVKALETEEHRLTSFTAGAAYATRTAANSYVWCQLSLATGKGQSILHRYDHPSNSWKASEPENWLLASRPPPMAVGEAITLAQRMSMARPDYMAALLSELHSEVPLRLPAGRIGFVNCTVDVPEINNPIGLLVGSIKNHSRWQNAWEPTAWEQEMRRLSEAIGAEFSSLGAESELDAREQNSRELIAAFLPQVANSTPQVLVELLACFEADDLARARLIIDHWKDHTSLLPQERLDVMRAEVTLFAREGNDTESALLSAHILEHPHHGAEDYVVAAKRAYVVREYSQAASRMHVALNAIPIDPTIRGLALKIAAASGDHTLARRVNP